MSSISFASCCKAIFVSVTLSIAFELVTVPAIGAESDTVRQYQLEKDGSEYRLNLKVVPEPTPSDGEVLVRVRATSLNRRDLLLTAGQYGFGGDYNGRVPVSDGAGEVVALGVGVTQFKVGDRVAGTFFANWPGGKRTVEGMSSSRGGRVDGMLSEMIVSHEDGLISIPDHLSYEEASTLPCAAITAWVALFTGGHLESDQTVLLEGTGGVSIFGLQFATAAGAKVIITSSSDTKLERARALGAFGTVNYRTTPEWQNNVRTLSGGGGVDLVLEVGGKDTLSKALQSLAFDGHIGIIGALTGRPAEIPVAQMQPGVSVSLESMGSRADFEAMNSFISEHKIRPVIDRVFSFEQASKAYDYMESGKHFGKIVIKL